MTLGPFTGFVDVQEERFGVDGKIGFEIGHAEKSCAGGIAIVSNVGGCKCGDGRKEENENGENLHGDR